MRWANKILLRWRSLFRRGHIERELDDELRFHLELQIEENITAGMSPEEARYAARRTLGRLAQMKEECRDMRRVNFIETLLQDIRYGWRMLHKSPGVTTVAIVSLALGIGANTAIFTIIDAVMLKMLPIKNPSELVQLSRYSQGQHGNFPYPDYEQLRDQNHVLAGVFAVSYPSGLKMRVAGETERVLCQYVTGNYYTVLGVNAIAGRVILPEDDKLTGPEPVAVLSYGFWKQRFGADPSV